MTDGWMRIRDTMLGKLPLEGHPRQLLRTLVQYAVLAPSSHNSQPWRFRLVDDGLELRVDQRRLLPVSDPNGRELRIACGAAIGNIEIAGRHFGLELSVKFLPDPIDRDLLARFRIVGSVDPTAVDHQMFEAIPHRHTVRRPFEGTPIPDGLKLDLMEAAARAGTWLEFIEADSDRQELAELITKADRMQMHDPDFRIELAQWLRPSRGHAVDGMPGHAYGLSAVASAVAPMVVRTFDLGDGRAAYHHALMAGSPGLAVLGTQQDRPPMWLDTGRALTRILLLATHHGVRTSYLNQPIEVGLMRNRLRALLVAEGHPQLILRLGYGPEGQATPRRSVEDVLE